MKIRKKKFKNPTIFWLLAGVYCRIMVILELYFGNMAIFLGVHFFSKIFFVLVQIQFFVWPSGKGIIHNRIYPNLATEKIRKQKNIRILLYFGYILEPIVKIWQIWAFFLFFSRKGPFYGSKSIFLCCQLANSLTKQEYYLNL